MDSIKSLSSLFYGPAGRVKGAVKGAMMGLGTAICLVLPGHVSAQDLLPPGDVPGEFSANVTLSTDYVYRGVSQSNRSPALSGGFDYSLGTGMADTEFYVGVWGSNIEQTYTNPDTDHSSTGNIELDFYGGLAGSIPVANGLGWDIGAIYYKYPGVPSKSEFDFVEVYGGLSYDFGVFGVEGSLAYSPDYFGGIGSSLYASSAVAIPLYNSLYVSGGFGRLMSLDADSGKGFEQASDWNFGIGVTLLGFDWAFTYYDVDGYSTHYPESFVASMTASF